MKQKIIYIKFLIAFLGIVSLIGYGAIPQWASYHNFADKRSFCGIPNFFDTFSNFSFFLAGLYLLIKFQKIKNKNSFSPKDTVFYYAMGLSLFSLFFGSFYYHLQPNNIRLVWDRLPIASFFSLLFLQILFEMKIIEDNKRNVILAFVYWFVSSISVFFWYYSGDLRVYAFAQFYPLICVLVLGIISFFVIEYKSYTKLFLTLIVGYSIAKVFEKFDYETLTLTNGLLSGHSIKHMIAGLTILFYFKLKKLVN